jgi:hypothetical protein
MKNGSHIVLLDPAMQDNEGTSSSNLGDFIISESILSLLGSLFPHNEIKRVSSHSFLTKKHRELIKSSAFSFIGGTNLLYSDMLTYRQLALRKGRLLWLFPGINDLILVGAGWGPDYKKKMTWRSSLLYNNILHRNYLHSVRDSFTADKLSKETRRKTINTACPSMWKLNDIDPNIEKRPGDCLFTLTDYRKDQENDSKLIGLLLESFKDIHFFPQGSGDLDYIRTLDIYTQNKTRIKLLPHDYKEFKQFINSTSFVYIGTRLHGGIKCLDASKKALILAVDNRAHEIGNDFLMPVIPRTDFQSMQRWLENKWVFSGKIKLPVDNINRWKQQFSSK